MTPNQLYGLADNLQMKVTRTGKTIAGARAMTVAFGDLKLEGTQEIISSAVFDDGCAVVLRMFGDLGALMTIQGKTLHCFVLDTAVFTAKRGVGFIEGLKVKSVASLEMMVTNNPAIVARFERVGVLPWKVYDEGLEEE